MARWDGHIKVKCEASGCVKMAQSKGLCGMHRQRMNRHGTLSPEIIRAPSGAPEAFIANALGSSTDECLIWPFALTSNTPERGGGEGKDYAQAKIDGRTRTVHTYICEKTHGVKPEGKEASHSCGRQPCINPCHLRWATRQENQADRVVHGTSNRGERQWNSKLTADNVIQIRRMTQCGRVCPRAISERFGVSPRTIRDVLNGTTWSWLTTP